MKFTSRKTLTFKFQPSALQLNYLFVTLRSVFTPTERRIMGAKQAKSVQQGDRETNTLIQDPRSHIEKSSGFHMFEIHLPSASFSVITTLLVMLCVAAIYAWWRRYTRRQEQRRILSAYYRRGNAQMELRSIPYRRSTFGLPSAFSVPPMSSRPLHPHSNSWFEQEGRPLRATSSKSNTDEDEPRIREVDE